MSSLSKYSAFALIVSHQASSTPIWKRCPAVLSETFNAGLGATKYDYLRGSPLLFEFQDEVGWLTDTVVIANIWQAVLSIIYFAFNSFPTTRASAMEWVRYGQAYRPLRVTFLKGEQKSTWVLSLLLKAAIPLTITLTQFTVLSLKLCSPSPLYATA